MEYLQQLWDKVLAEDAALSESTRCSQAVGTKYKEVTLGDKEKWQPSKKNKGKQPARYHRDAGIKIGRANPCERYVHARIA